jgi:hypothetical protein
MLPYDDNENEDGSGGDYPFDESNYNDHPGVQFDDYQQATEFFDALSDYMHDQGFSNEAWFDMVTEVTNMEIWYDDDGNMHYNIEFDWWYEDGGYGGHASASG